ncbi:MAG: TonB-dependent receptor, partial [Bacteroidota bacterium]|nr:TonB-dependent receptor [Bacteroidota bacterium]
MKSLYKKRTPFFYRLRIAIYFLLISSAAFCQNVDGIVTDEDGGPLPGATIVIKGTNTFAVTDVDGKFTIRALKTFPFTLQFRILGYRSQQVEVYELSADPLEITLSNDNLLDAITVTARRRSEISTDVPIPVSIVNGAQIEDGGAFNVNRVKELIPSVQLYSSNPRNTALNVRGLGTTFGLTNDGIDPGVGFYVDGVYYARPAAATLDFIDVERIEVLRGPQGTLFGKNTTAGAFNITTRKPSFDTDGTLEVSYGNLGYLQVRSSLTGKLTKKLAGRISFTGTHRDGTLYNVARNEDVNTLNNTGVRGQLLYTPTDNVEIIFAADATRQRPVGYAQVVAGVVPTQRPDYRQFNSIIADLGYSLPSANPFDRLIDHDTPWRSDNDLGGLSVNVDAKLGQGTLSSTTAWRYWNWDPSNDRDFTGLQALSRSEGTSRHYNWSQEVRYAGDLTSSISVVGGVYAIGQVLNTDPVHTEESGSAQW